MILVHDEDTLEQAVQLVQQDAVHCSDRYQFRTVTSPVMLRTIVAAAYQRNEIVLVGKLDEGLPDYRTTWRAYKAEQREKRKQDDKEMRAWIRAHPAEIKEMMRRMRQ